MSCATPQANRRKSKQMYYPIADASPSALENVTPNQRDFQYKSYTKRDLLEQ
jgi:hypothetical protein